jgi:replicative superfamily II helicase
MFGIGLHHAGLPHDDKVIVEKLFLEEKIQVWFCSLSHFSF